MAARGVARQASFIGITESERPTFSVNNFRRTPHGYLSGGAAGWISQQQVQKVRAAWSKPVHLRSGADVDALIEFCSHIPFLRGLVKMRAELAQIFQYRRVPRGTVVLEPGDEQAKVFVLLAGAAEMVVEDALTSASYPAITLGPGDLFGEEADDEKRRVTVTAASDLELLAVEDEELAELQDKQHSKQVEEAVAFLQRIPLFADMSRKQLLNLCSGLQTRTALRSTLIVRQDEEPDAVYVIKSGSCRVLREIPVPEAARALLAPPGPARSPSPARVRSRSPPAAHTAALLGDDEAAARGRPAPAPASGRSAAAAGAESPSPAAPPGLGLGTAPKQRATFEVGLLSAEDVFGEVGVLLGVRRRATVVAESTCELLVISKQDFLYKLPPHVTERFRQFALAYPGDEAMLRSFTSSAAWAQYKEAVVGEVVGHHAARRMLRASGFHQGAAPL
eukprot:tig00000405_g458.t1